nr:HPr kinase/phosphatase C-terminal domain-containing protein [Novosphingobium taihuense]
MQAGCVSIGGRGVLIFGPSGVGKSSLALAMIDRGAMLVGDDGVMIEVRAGQVFAAPHPNIIGKLEVRNLGLLEFPVSASVPVALAVQLDREAPRFIEAAEALEIDGVVLPQVRLWPDSPVLALRAELALSRYGLTIS